MRVQGGGSASVARVVGSVDVAVELVVFPLQIRGTWLAGHAEPELTLIGPPARLVQLAVAGS